MSDSPYASFMATGGGLVEDAQKVTKDVAFAIAPGGLKQLHEKTTSPMVRNLTCVVAVLVVVVLVLILLEMWAPSPFNSWWGVVKSNVGLQGFEGIGAVTAGSGKLIHSHLGSLDGSMDQLPMAKQAFLAGPQGPWFGDAPQYVLNKDALNRAALRDYLGAKAAAEAAGGTMVPFKTWKKQNKWRYTGAYSGGNVESTRWHRNTMLKDGMRNSGNDNLDRKTMGDLY